MRNSLKTFLTIIFILSQIFLEAQTITNFVEGHPSAVLDMSNNPTTRGFVPPRVSLNDLTDTESPIQNPATGLIVYNTGTNQLPGFYIFEDGVWSLLASRENSVSNAVFNKLNTTTLALTTSYVTIGGFTQLFNNSAGFITLTDDDIALQPGKYVVNIELNVSTEEPITNSIGGSVARTHTHFYSGRLWDGANAVGGVVNTNASSNTSATIKKHIVSFSFSFELTTLQTVNFQLSRRNGGSFAGSININNAFIQIEKSTL